MKQNYFADNFLKKLRTDFTYKSNHGYPKFSIIMPCLNHEEFIERSILSILNQNYPNTELIIIDGGSTDKTLQIIEKYRKYIFFFISKKDQGQSDALNKGFEVATGEIYGWLNSDDLYLPNTFHKVREVFIKKKEKFFFFGDWLSIDEKDNVLDINHAFNFNLNHFKYEGFHLNSQSMFWKSCVHKSFSGFKLNLYNTMDYQMILEFGIKFGQTSFYRISDILGAFRRHDRQKTQKINNLVLAEHKIIADLYDYSDKYSFIGKLKKLYFRFRRAYWYYKRGGLENLIKRIRLYANQNK